MSKPTIRIPKGLHHLETTKTNRFTNRVPTRVDGRPKQWVPLDARIRRWNIWPEDKVRVVVGKPADKYQNESNAKEGWKIHTVKYIDMERNTVYLDGVTNTKHNPIRPFPDDMDTMSEEDANRYRNQSNKMQTSRAVAYSNVQLCVEDRTPAPSVFATRIATSTPSFDPVTRRMRWNRYAAKLSIDDDNVPGYDSNRQQIKIQWPVYKSKLWPTATPLDSDIPAAQAVTFNPSPATAYQPDEIPSSLNAPSLDVATLDFADTYIDKPEQRANPQTDSIMPMMLAEELSPRFSRAKITQGWNERREIEAAERAKFAAEAVSRWEAAGRDAELGDVLKELSLAGGDIRMRGRTRKEVREAAEAEFDALVIQGRRETKLARSLGQVWEPTLGQYTEASDRGERRSKRRIRLDRKAAKQEARMVNLQVEPGRNTVLPPS